MVTTDNNQNRVFSFLYKQFKYRKYEHDDLYKCYYKSMEKKIEHVTDLYLDNVLAKKNKNQKLSNAETKIQIFLPVLKYCRNDTKQVRFCQGTMKIGNSK